MNTLNQSRSAAALSASLRAEIVDGTRQPGDRLPSHAEAAALWACDRGTVATVYRQLEAEHLIEIRGNAGTFVASRRPAFPEFDWNRYWVRDAAASRVLMDGPFLLIYNSSLDVEPTVQTLDELQTEPFSILLGEAGMGKTYALARFERSLKQSGHAVVLWQGRTIGSAAALREDVRRELSRGQHGAVRGPLVLIVDGLDEAVCGSASVLDALRRLLEEYANDQLRICVSCRSTAWTSELFDQCVRTDARDPKERAVPGVWRLLPLQRDDAVAALRQAGSRPEDAASVVRDPRLAVLASRPFTLRFLLSAARAGRLTASSSIVSIYRDGIAELLSGIDQARENAGNPRRSDGAQRMSIAARLAAVDIVCGRPEFSFRLGAITHGSIGVSKALGHTPVAPGSESLLSHDRESVFDALSSAVFDHVGSGVFRFAHKSFAEFLAAEYLATSGFTEDHLRSMLWAKDGKHRRLVPELIETAAWLAASRTDVLADVMDNQPEVLLLSDTPAFSDEQREQLVSAYIKRVHEKQISWTLVRALESSYPRLAHPRLAEQIEGMLRDGSLNDAAREVAAEIAERATLMPCVPALIDIVLDESAAERLRVSAIYAVRSLGINAEQAHRLRRVPLQEVRGDEDQNILGCVLHLLWPGHLSATELFEALVPQFRTNLYGAYAAFLSSSALTKGLKDDDLPQALGWVAKQSFGRQPDGDMATAYGMILYRAWRSIDRPGVADAMAPLVFAHLDTNEPFMVRPWDEREGGVLQEGNWQEQEIRAEPARRRQLLGAILCAIAGEAKGGTSQRTDVLRLLFGRSRLALREDLEWLIERSVNAEAHVRPLWIELTNRIVCFEAADAWTTVERDLLARSWANSGPSNELLDFLRPVELASDRARELRESFNKYRKLGRKERRPRKVRPALRDLIESWFAAVPADPGGAWSGIAYMLVFGRSWDTNENSMWTSGKHIADRELWKSADVALRERVIDAAVMVIQTYDPSAEQLIDDHEKIGSPQFLLEALHLLNAERADFLEKLPAERWAVWAPLLAASTDEPKPDDPRERRLVELAYRRAPNQVVQTLLRIVKRAQVGSDERQYSRVCRWENVADERMVKPLGTLLLNLREPHRWQITHALRLLLKIDGDEGLRAAQRFVGSASQAPDSSPESLSVAAAAALARWHPRAGWSTVWPMLQQHSDWARSLLIELVGNRVTGSAGFISRMTESELANLVVWLFRDFDIGELPDRRDGGVYSPSAAEELDSFRNACLGHLMSSGSQTAIAALENLCEHFPQNPRFRDCLLQLLDAAASSRRPEVTPEDLDRLIEDSRRVLVETPEQLLDAVTQSLKRLEARLQGSESPIREILWNRCSNGGEPKPKDETHLAVIIKDHLNIDLCGRGLVANREVQILPSRISAEDQAGKRLDILVQAVGKGGRSASPISVVIEIKLDTNPEWRTGLKTQLYDRYLHENRSRHGLYVIGATDGVTPKNQGRLHALHNDADALTQRASGGRVVTVLMIDCGLERRASKPRSARKKRSTSEPAKQRWDL